MSDESERKPEAGDPDDPVRTESEHDRAAEQLEIIRDELRRRAQADRGLFSGFTSPAQRTLAVRSGSLICAYLALQALYRLVVGFDVAGLMGGDPADWRRVGVRSLQVFCAVALGVLVYRRGGLLEVWLTAIAGFGFAVFMAVVAVYAGAVLPGALALMLIACAVQMLRARYEMRRLGETFESG